MRKLRENIQQGPKCHEPKDFYIMSRLGIPQSTRMSASTSLNLKPSH